MTIASDLTLPAVTSAQPPSRPAEPSISATVPDWSREEHHYGYWNPGKYVLRAHRRYQRWKGRWGIVGKIVCKAAVVQNRIWGLLTGCDIPVTVKLGGGLMMPHPQGIIVYGEASIGPNCLLFQQVTIGYGGKVPGYPTLGGHVDVGAGAKILGGVKIGDHARIGANAVVLCDVPPGRTAVGVPARIV